MHRKELIMNYVELHHRMNIPVHCRTQEDFMHLFAVSPELRKIYEVKRKAMQQLQNNTSTAIKDNSIKCPKWVKGIVNFFRKHLVM